MVCRLLLVLAAVVVSAAPHASADYWRQESGTITATAPKDDAVEEWLAAERCWFQAVGNDPAADLIGRVVSLSEAESDGSHRFALFDGDMGPWDAGTGEPVFSRDADFDVTFYADLGSCDGTTRLPTPADPPRFAGPGNESGMIAPGMRFAVVTLANSPFSTFVFEVTKP